MRPLVVAAAGTALIWMIMSVNGLIPHEHPAFEAYDHTVYLAMARDGIGAPGKASTAPFCWRILTPWLAGVAPVPTTAAFWILSFLSVTGSALAVYALCRLQGHTPGWSHAGMAFYLSCFWGTGFNLWNYLMVDAPALLLIATGLLILESPARSGALRMGGLVLVLLLAALNKESWLVLGAAVVVWQWRHTEGGMLRRAASALLPLVPAAAAVVAVRWAIAADPGQLAEFPDYRLADVLMRMVQTRLASIPQWLMEALYDPWGPLVVAPALLAPLRTWRWLVRHPHRLALLSVSFSQILMGTSVGRLVAAGLPVVALYVTDRLREDARPRPGIPLGVLFGLQMVFQYARRTTLGLGVPPYTPHPVLVYAYAARAAAMVLSLPAWCWLRGRFPGRGPRDASPNPADSSSTEDSHRGAAI